MIHQEIEEIQNLLTEAEGNQETLLLVNLEETEAILITVKGDHQTKVPVPTGQKTIQDLIGIHLETVGIQGHHPEAAVIVTWVLPDLRQVEVVVPVVLPDQAEVVEALQEEAAAKRYRLSNFKIYMRAEII
jgi:hypothetical protein